MNGLELLAYAVPYFIAAAALLLIAYLGWRQILHLRHRRHRRRHHSGHVPARVAGRSVPERREGSSRPESDSLTAANGSPGRPPLPK